MPWGSTTITSKLTTVNYYILPICDFCLSPVFCMNIFCAFGFNAYSSKTAGDAGPGWARKGTDCLNHCRSIVWWISHNFCQLHSEVFSLFSNFQQCLANSLHNIQWTCKLYNGLANFSTNCKIMNHFTIQGEVIHNNMMEVIVQSKICVRSYNVRRKKSQTVWKLNCWKQYLQMPSCHR